MLCVMCSLSFEPNERIFEQRLIDDSDFCLRCFKEILNADYNESDLDLTVTVRGD